LPGTGLTTRRFSFSSHDLSDEATTFLFQESHDVRAVCTGILNLELRSLIENVSSKMSDTENSTGIARGESEGMMLTAR
jgi:hypothetical protein